MPRNKNLVEILITAKNMSGKEISQAESQMDRLGKQVRKTSQIMMVSGAAVAGSLLAITKRTAKTIDEYRKFERATGVQVNTLAALRFAIQRWGGTQRDADTSLRRLTKAIADGGSGLESYLRVWRRLGLSQDDLVGPDGTMAQVQDILPIIANRFEVITDATLKADAAQILFGRGGLRLIPLLNQGAEGLDKMADRAKRLGRFFGEETLDNAEAFQDAMLDIGHAVQGVGFAIGTALMPAVTNASNRITELLIMLRQWTEDNGSLVRSIAALSLAVAGTGGLLFGITALAGAFKILAVTTGLAAGPLGVALTVITLLGGAILKAKLDNLAKPRTMAEVREELDATTKSIEEVTGAIAKIDDKAFFDEGFSPRGPAGAKRAGTAEQVAADRIEREKLLTTMERLLDKARRLTDELEAPELAAERQRKIEEERARNLERAARQAAKLRKELQGSDEMFAIMLSEQPAGTGLVLEIDHLTTKVARLNEEYLAAMKIAEDTALNDERFIERGEEAKKLLKEWSEATVTLNGKKQDLKASIAELLETQRELAADTSTAITKFTELLIVEGQIISTTHAMGETMRIAQASLGSGIQASLSRVMVAGNKFRDSFTALWRGIAQTVISSISQMIAKMIAMKVVMGFLMAVFPGSFVGLGGGGLGGGLLSGLGTIIGHTGGTLKGRGNIPVLAQGGENLIDRNSNERLNAFLDGIEEGGMGGGNVVINAGLYTGTKQENKYFQDFQRRSSAGFERRNIARGTR